MITETDAATRAVVAAVGVKVRSLNHGKLITYSDFYDPIEFCKKKIDFRALFKAKLIEESPESCIMLVEQEPHVG